MGKDFKLPGPKASKPKEKRKGKYDRYNITEMTQAGSGEFIKFNMAFTNDNYELIQKESQQLGVSMQFFINALVHMIESEDVDTYINSLPVKPNKNHISRRKGDPVKRINYGIEKNAHKLITNGSEKHEMTRTQYVNIIISMYAQDFS